MWAISRVVSLWFCWFSLGYTDSGSEFLPILEYQAEEGAHLQKLRVLKVLGLGRYRVQVLLSHSFDQVSAQKDPIRAALEGSRIPRQGERMVPLDPYSRSIVSMMQSFSSPSENRPRSSSPKFKRGKDKAPEGWVRYPNPFEDPPPSLRFSRAGQSLEGRQRQDLDLEISPQVTLVFCGRTEKVLLFVSERFELLAKRKGQSAWHLPSSIEGNSLEFELTLDFELESLGAGLFSQDELLIDYAKNGTSFDYKGAWLLFRDPSILPQLPVLRLHPKN
jgi:hypothetical protein